MRKRVHSLLAVLMPAFQIQLITTIGYLVSLIVSYFYLFQNDTRFPMEKPMHIAAGAIISGVLALIGWYVPKKINLNSKLNLAHGAWVIFWVWIIACSVSSYVFMLSGFPVPDQVAQFSTFRIFIDGFYESMSGFTTTGTSILPSIEVFPRSIIFWRSLTHWIGGMGIAYMAITVFKFFSIRRAEVINSEAESPHIVQFKNEDDARASGFDFLKTYSCISLICFVLLIISGYFFRQLPYEHWYDNVFDALTMMFGTLATGGFSPYNASVGLPIIENGVSIIGGLRNPVSEWILAIFMMFGAMNFTLWYLLIFKKDLKQMFRNKEFITFWLFVIVSSITITYYLYINGIHSGIFESLRYAFFNVASVISTTGYVTDDFALWPIAAQGILFASYLVGGCVGSTSGGLKFTRFLVLFQYMKIQLKNVIHGHNETTFIIDGIKYNDRSSGLIITNIVIYYMIFLVGAIFIMLSGSQAIFTDGSVRGMDFVSAFTASIANLGNIGPAIVNGVTGHGPTGNYSAYTTLAKIVMVALMFIGRVGVLTCIMLFINRANNKIGENSSSIEFDADAPMILGR